MPTTPKGFRYPAAGDAPNVPLDMQELAEDIDNYMGSRGSAVIATDESRTNVAYGLLTTPDRVQNVVVAAGQILCVAYQAEWASSAVQAGRAAIFIGSNQLRVPHDNSVPEIEAAGDSSAIVPGRRSFLTTCPIGLVSLINNVGDFARTSPMAIAALSLNSSSNFGAWAELDGTLVKIGDVTGNGQDAVGGVCMIDVDPGTYDVSVQFKASSGSVSARNRKLRVWTERFAV